MSWMPGVSCDAARLLWLLDRDRPLPFWSRTRLGRHLAGCTACRKFIEDAGELAGKLAPALSPPVDDALVHRIVAAASWAGDGVPESAPWRRWAPVGIPACAAIALLAILFASALLVGPADRAGQLDDRLAAAQTELVQAITPLPRAPTRATVEDRLGGLEDSVRCLRTELEEVNWNSWLGGDPCTDS